MEFAFGWVVLSFVAGLIAAVKGRSGFGYFLLSLVLSPLVGLLLAIALPKVEQPPPAPVAGHPVEGTRIACPQCAELVLPAAKVCRFCGHRLKSD